MARWFSKILKSTNGTFLDGVRLTEPATLREGQVVARGRPALDLRAPQPPRHRSLRGTGPRSPKGEQIRVLPAARADHERTGAGRLALRPVDTARRRRVRILLARSADVRLLPSRRVRTRCRLGHAFGDRAQRASPAGAARRRFPEPGGSADKPERKVSDGQSWRAVLHDVVRRVRCARSHARSTRQPAIIRRFLSRRSARRHNRSACRH